MNKFFTSLMLMMIAGLGGCASSQTTREESVYCQGDYLYALKDSTWPVAPYATSMDESYLTTHLNDKLNSLMRLRSHETLEGEKSKERYRVLIMSGGGQNGAFGAGVLNGWSSRTTGLKRADIDMVTTISTGAMALIYTMVGNYGLDKKVDGKTQPERADAALKAIFTEVDEEDLLEKKGLLKVITTNSLANTVGLGKKMDEAIETFMPIIQDWADDDPWAGKVAYTGTVNMDDGQFYVADMLHVARETKVDDRASDCYKEIILATSAEPAFFPPRFITPSATDPLQGKMYVDGGIRFGVFWDENLKILKRRNMAVDVYVIVNGDMATDDFFCDDQGNCHREMKTINNKIVDIAKRAAVIAVDQLYKSSLDRIYWKLLQEFGPQDFTMNMTYIKPEAIEQKKCKKSEGAFDRAYMGCLYKIGEDVGKNWTWGQYSP